MTELVLERDFQSDPPLTSAEAACTTIAEAIADAEGVSPLDIDPLYESIDPDALGRFLDSADLEDDVSVTFTHAQWTVTVQAGGRVLIDEA